MGYQEFKTKYNILANKQQDDAIQHIDGPALLLAVPGSGKTTVIVARTGYMIFEKHIAPENILTVTFTTAAAKEMEERFVKKFSYTGTMPHFSTIHSLCVTILKLCRHKHGVFISTLEPNNTKIVRKVLIDILDEYPDDGIVAQIAQMIGYIKNSMASAEDIKRLAVENEYISKAYYAYLDYMDTNALMDFDDQLLLAYQYLQQYPDILEMLQEKYRYISVDEAQDTSYVQHQIIRLLASKYQNIFMVGDEDQCWTKDGTVLTDKGEKRVEELVVGDMVQTLYCGEAVFSEITNITERSARSAVKLHVCYGSPKSQLNSTLTVTPNHKLFIKHRRVPLKKWVISVAMNYEYNCQKVQLIGDGVSIEKEFADYKSAMTFAYYLKKEYGAVIREQLFFNNCWYWAIPAYQAHAGQVMLALHNDRITKCQITNIEALDYFDKVYDIEVAQTGNLFVNNVLSHNCIYGFRGAYPQALLEFQKIYPHAVQLLMETNYRSTKEIVAAADKFIKQNKNRFEKHMVTGNEKGQKISEKKLDFMEGQYRYLLAQIKAVPSEKTLAILYRNNSSAIPLIDLLDKEGVNFNCRDGMDLFFANSLVLDALALLNFASNPRDLDSYSRLYYKFNLFLSKSHLTDVNANLEQYPNKSIWDIVFENNAFIRIKEELGKLKIQFQKAAQMQPKEAIEFLVYKTNYKNYLNQKMKNDIEQSAPTILYALYSVAQEYKTIPEFLEGIERLQKARHKRTGSNITLSTIHSSKGLEFDTVILIDTIEGIFPTLKAEGDELESEVRLFYVAVTRAKERLILLTADKWFKRTIKPSPFIRDILPKANIDVKIQWKHPSKDNSLPEQSIPKGTPVVHKAFGKGTVMSLKGDTITINFRGKVKAFSLSFVLNNQLLTIS